MPATEILPFFPLASGKGCSTSLKQAHRQGGLLLQLHKNLKGEAFKMQNPCEMSLYLHKDCHSSISKGST